MFVCGPEFNSRNSPDSEFQFYLFWSMIHAWVCGPEFNSQNSLDPEVQFNLSRSMIHALGM